MRISVPRREAKHALVLTVLIAVLVACGGTTPPPAGTPATTVEITADNLAFDRDVLTVPAGAPFAIRFENREAAPHNVSIHGSEALFTGEVFSGPAERTYLVPALAAGQYRFLCDVHPDMQGTVTSQ